MNKFEKIRIRGYRRLFDTEIEMRPLTVMLGANGSGKTSFLEAWSLLAASCRSQLAEKMSEYHGLNDILTRNLAQSLMFDVTMSMGEQPRDAKRILEQNDLSVAANAYPELKALPNTILTLCDGEIIP